MIGDRVALRGTVRENAYGLTGVYLDAEIYCHVKEIHAKPIRKAKPVKKLIEFIKMVEAAHYSDSESSISALKQLAIFAIKSKKLLKEWEK
jgi:hypothetical protein